MQQILDMLLERLRMFNAWEGLIPSGEKIIHASSSKFRILQYIHAIIDSQFHRIGFRILKRSKFRIPQNPNLPRANPPKQIRLELTLTQCIWRSIVAISEKKGTIQTSLSYFDKEQETICIISIPNSGRAFQSAITLYDKQVVLQESLHSGYIPPRGNLSQIFYKKRNSIYVFIKFVSVRTDSKLKVLINRLRKKQINWSIGISPIGHFPPDIQNELRIGSGSNFAADPFLCKVNSDTYVFFETIKNGKGIIEYAEVNSQGIGDVSTALVESFHLSFPYIVRHENDIYMLPETSEREEIRLYKCTSFPTEWSFSRTLIPDVLAADSILVQSENEWHLITNLSTGLVKNFGSELWHFSARDFHQDEWYPNKNNPISMDGEVSRNAGSYKVGNNLFRCNQVPGFSQYGFGVQINQILQLSNSSYREIPVEKYLGGYHPKDNGCHHFTISDGMVAYDFSYESAKRL